jgi:hypothetical protein
MQQVIIESRQHSLRAQPDRQHTRNVPMQLLLLLRECVCLLCIPFLQVYVLLLQVLHGRSQLFV